MLTLSNFKKINKCDIGSFWSPHILEIVKGTTHLFEHFRQEFSMGYVWHFLIRLQQVDTACSCSKTHSGAGGLNTITPLLLNEFYCNQV
jgi:hypothetical protein